MSNFYSNDRPHERLGDDNDRRGTEGNEDSRRDESYNTTSDDRAIGRGDYYSVTGGDAQSREYGRNDDGNTNRLTSDLRSDDGLKSPSSNDTSISSTQHDQGFDEETNIPSRTTTDSSSSHNEGNTSSSQEEDTADTTTAVPSSYDSTERDPPTYTSTTPRPNPIFSSSSDYYPTDTMPTTEPHAPETRLGVSDATEPYLGGHSSYGSGTTSGPGHGNKTASSDPENLDTAGTRLDSAQKTEAYTGGTEYGSGVTAGPGMGNKTASSTTGSDDSTMGKLMEKAGSMLRKDGLVEKGTEKREAAGYDGSS